jgi:hypothetical protein
MAAFAVVLAFLGGSVGMGGAFPDGHFASAAAIGTAGQNMWRWKTLFPVTRYLDRAPPASLYYMHHPLAVFWVIAVLGKMLTFSNWVLRLPALFYVVATTALVHKLGRTLWGPLAGGLAALAYVALPITLGYANYHDLEQPVMFGCVLATWAYVRFIATWRRRYAVLGALGLFYALNHDWPAYVWAAAFLIGVAVYAFAVPERLSAPLRRRPLRRYWALMCAAVVSSLAIETIALASSGRLADVLGSYALRSAGAATPLSVVLAARHYRINLMFTALGVVLGKLAVPVMVSRAVARRDHRELLPLPLLCCAVVQYVVFKEGADVHIFWPHYFAAYFALGVGSLTAGVEDAAKWIGRRRLAAPTPRLTCAAPWLALALVGLPVCLVLKDGLSLIRLARETGGRFAEANLDGDLDKVAVARWFLSRFPPSVGIAYHAGIYDGWALQWETRPRLTAGNQPLAGPGGRSARIYMLDTQTTPVAELRSAAAAFHVHAVGNLWIFDRAEPAAPLDGYVLDEREPALWEKWWLGPTDPVRTVRANAWSTWEWRSLLGQAAQLPTGTPTTTEELRIAHNASLVAGNFTTAARFLDELLRRFNRPFNARYDGGTALIGAIQSAGARRGVRLFFLAGSFAGDARFSVHARVSAPPAFSTLPADPNDLETPGNPTWPTTLWRRDHIYTVAFVIRKRPGTEVFTGAWKPGPARADGPDPIELARL